MSPFLPELTVRNQILMMNPLTFPFWLGGCCSTSSLDAKRYRAFGFAFLITVACFFPMHGKDYYSAPAYGLVLAAGGAAAERLVLMRSEKMQALLKPASFAWLLAAIVRQCRVEGRCRRIVGLRVSGCDCLGGSAVNALWKVSWADPVAALDWLWCL
jgi:hypothetical protein